MSFDVSYRAVPAHITPGTPSPPPPPPTPPPLDLTDPDGPQLDLADLPSPDTSEFLAMEKQMEEESQFIGSVETDKLRQLEEDKLRQLRQLDEQQRRQSREFQSELEAALEERERKRSEESAELNGGMAEDEASLQLMERRQFRSFNRADEYLYAMKEDLAEWLNALYPGIDVGAENFMDRLETGEHLIKVGMTFGTPGLCGMSILQ